MTRPVYTAANPVEAEIVKDYLAAHGIPTSVRGHFAWGAVGELPFPEAYPRLFLESEHQRAQARELLRAYEGGAAAPSWTCAGCKEPCPGTFAVCWNCGAPKD